MGDFMPFTPAGKARMLSAAVGTPTGSPIGWVSVHSAQPDNNGSNEIVTTRQQVTFGSPSGDSVSITGQPLVPIPGGNTVNHAGFWTAVTGGTFMGWDAVTSETFTEAGEYRVNTATLTLTD